MSWIELDRDSFLKAVKVMNLVPFRSGIPSSDYIRIRLAKKKMELAIASSVSGQSSVALPESMGEQDLFVDRRMFLPFCLAAEKRKGDFKLLLEEGKLHIHQGKRKAELALYAGKVQGYGKWRDINGLKEVKLEADLKTLLVAASSCATADPSLQHLNCVFMDGNLLLSSNQTMMLQGSGKGKNTDFPFPVGIIPLLGDSLVQGVGIENGMVILDCEVGYIEGTVAAPGAKKFPKKDILFNMKAAQKYPVLLTIKPKALAEAMAHLIEYLAGVKRDEWVLKIAEENGELYASAAISQGGFKERIKGEGFVKGCLIELPLETIKPVVDFIQTKEEEISIQSDESKKTPMLVHSKTVDLLIARIKRR